MRTYLMLHESARPQLFCLLLAIGLMLAITLARAEDGNSELPLKVTGGNKRVQLEYPLWIEVENLERWAEQPGNDTSQFVLCLDGHAFKGLPPPSLRADENLLGFYIRPASESKDEWKNVVGRPLSKDDQEMSATVLYDAVKIKGFSKVRIKINRSGLITFLVFVVVSLIIFWWLAYKSDIVRGPGPQPARTDGTPDRKPYSLARTQMAWWFFVVVISYVFIWMLTEDLASLTPSVLALIGISAATGLSSAIVDSSKRSDQENLLRTVEEQKKKNEAEVEKLRSQITTLTATQDAKLITTNLEKQTEAITAKRGELAAKEKEIDQAEQKISEVQEKQQPVASKGFMRDILSDENGISFHRFQLFAWTIVLTVIFITKVYNDLGMPDFDATVLGLMGISSGTYIGFKLPAQPG